MKQNTTLFHRRQYPNFIKYMGSKSAIMDFVLEGISTAYNGGAICDLFSGSASLAGAIGDQVNMHINDIQSYTCVLADSYLNSADIHKEAPQGIDLVSSAHVRFNSLLAEANTLTEVYERSFSLEEFNKQEQAQQRLIEKQLKQDYHLFTKYYSGTWWSTEQCAWIDALKEQADKYSGPTKSAILSSLMFAMAYSSQGTGHYAQYRDANTQSSMNDILTYRRRSLTDYFLRKYNEILTFAENTSNPHKPHKITALDYKEALATFEGGTIYADPPYCFVHYSRFYHALETLVQYDYPDIQERNGTHVKGRYRVNRHQSPFCIKTQVVSAFKDLFKGVASTESNLVLSYSNTGMISIEEIEMLLLELLPNKKHELLTIDHQHMTLGRANDRHRNVKECLFMAY